MKPVTSINEKIKVEGFLSSISQGDYCGRYICVILKRTGWFLRDLFCKGSFKWRDDNWVYQKALTASNEYADQLSIKWGRIYIPYVALAAEEILGISDVHEIVPGLFLGNQTAATDPETIRRLGIETIICCTTEPLAPLDNVRYVQLNHGDVNTTITPLFQRSYAAIDQGLRNKGKVLVHCSAGASRSAAQVIAYLMKKYDLPFEHAFHHVRFIRPIVNPAEKFKQELKDFERRPR